MNYSQKYKVLKVIEGRDLELHTQKGWELLQVLSETVLESVNGQVANPHPPPSDHKWSGDNYGGWTPQIFNSSFIGRRVPKMLMGLNGVKFDQTLGDLQKTIDQLTGDKKYVAEQLEKVQQELDKTRNELRSTFIELEQSRSCLRVERNTQVQDKKMAEVLNKENLELKGRLLQLEEMIKRFPDSKEPLRMVEP